jgi:hypothetical protein
MLPGEAFPDAIANGTYPVDIHSDTRLRHHLPAARRLVRQTYRGDKPVGILALAVRRARMHARFYQHHAALR